MKLGYSHDTLILNFHPSTSCSHIANNLVEEGDTTCFGIVYDSSPLIENSPPLLRFENETPLTSLQFAGFFSKPGNFKGRHRFIDKMSPLLASLTEVESEMDQLLLERGIKRGDDVVVMVVNAGEMDLFMNFACSCHLHNISLHNILVFAASSDIVPLIFSTGAFGYYHHDFATASREHSVVSISSSLFSSHLLISPHSLHLILGISRWNLCGYDVV